MATLTVDIEAEEISLMTWEAPAMLEESGITPEDLHGEWSALDLYIRDDCEVALTFERVADWIAEGELSDGELRDLSFRIARELVGRLESVRQCADRYLDTTRQQADRIRELERASGIDSSDNVAAIA
jgi:hypothetical protein